MATVRQIPPQVIAAQQRGDFTALSEMGVAGNRKKKQLRAAAAAAAKARAEAQRQADEARRAAEDAEFDAFCEREWRQQVYADALAHAMRNLAGSSQD